MSVAPYKDGHGRYKWQLWTLLPLRSFTWFLGRKVPTPIGERSLYDALGVAIDTEGEVSARRQRGRSTRFNIILYNKKKYVIKPLRQVLAQLGYNPIPIKVPRGSKTSYGFLSSDCLGFVVHSKGLAEALHLKWQEVEDYGRQGILLGSSTRRSG